MSTAAAAISTASDIRPTPPSLASAISPALGPIMVMPSRRSCSTLRRVAAVVHINRVITRAHKNRRLVASREAPARAAALAGGRLLHQTAGVARPPHDVPF